MILFKLKNFAIIPDYNNTFISKLDNINDIYNTLEMGANGLVLAAETAIGKYPIECVQTLQKIIKIFHKNKKKF